jgi:hypothetical protein
MNTTRRVVSGLCSACVGLLSIGSAVAATANLPKVQQYAGTPYISGGVSIDERKALLQMSRDDNLQLIFAAQNGEYLSDVHVAITKSNGQQVLSTMAQGPWLFTKLPAGTYRVTAGAKGRSLHHVVHVSRRGQTRVLLSWDNSILKPSSMASK